MGMMIFQLPANLSGEALDELERASVAGGQDHMPYSTQILLDEGRLMLSRPVDESGCLLAPWEVAGVGRLMVSSATLMERLLPYHFQLELARGKVNQLRGQTSDWLLGGLILPEAVANQVRQAVLAFARAVARYPSAESDTQAEIALRGSYQAAESLVQAYMSQVFQVRHCRQPRLDTLLACRLGKTPLVAEHQAGYQKAFNAVQVPLAWADVEPVENQWSWEKADRMIEAALALNGQVQGGPLVDFSGRGLPDWLWEKETDLSALGGYLCDFVQLVVRRYQGRVRGWQVTAGSNVTGVLAVGDEELLWLTVRLVEAVRRADPQAEVVAGIAQPWGDYLAHQERSQSPFAFADNLIRTGVKLAALDLELILGVTPRGSYCRDALEASRLLDLYALLGVPLQITLGYPSAPAKETHADQDLRADAGHWRTGFSPEVQAEWAAAFTSLGLCKPYVRSMVWAHYFDGDPHQFPHCGLIDSTGKPKPALQQLTALRDLHLK